MDDTETVRFRQHYATISDDQLLELLNGEEAALVEGAYRLVKEAAIKRNLVDSEGIVVKSKRKHQHELKWESYRASKINNTYGHFLRQVLLVCIGFCLVAFAKGLLSGEHITGEVILMALVLLIGIPSLLSLLWLCHRKWMFFTGDRYASEQEVKVVAEKMERCEYISPEDFAVWKKSSYSLPYSAYEEYLKEYSKTPEKREEDRKEMEELLEATDLGVYLKKKK